MNDENKVAKQATAEEVVGEEAEQAFLEDPDAGLAEGSQEGMPEWVILPPDFEKKVPVGRQVVFMRFLAEWTDTPHLGDRQCILWSLTEGEEKRAYQLARTDIPQVAIMELTKACIRVVDGKWADYTRDPRRPGSVTNFVNEIGRRCAREINNWYMRAHVLDAEKRADFYKSCVGYMSARPT